MPKIALSLSKARPWLLILALAGCESGPEEAPAAAPPAEPVPLVTPAAKVRPIPAPEIERRDLCTVLAGVVDVEIDGFTKLRGQPVDAETWISEETLPGTERCTIVGTGWPRVRLACDGHAFKREQAERAEAEFEKLSGEIDDCLASPIWFPRTWRRGSPFDFAMGERLQTWTDESTTPPSQVVLKMQRDLTGQSYRLKLNLEAVP